MLNKGLGLGCALEKPFQSESRVHLQREAVGVLPRPGHGPREEDRHRNDDTGTIRGQHNLNVGWFCSEVAFYFFQQAERLKRDRDANLDLDAKTPFCFPIPVLNKSRHSEIRNDLRHKLYTISRFLRTTPSLAWFKEETKRGPRFPRARGGLA